MARKTQDARAAREKKQKIFVAVGAVIFLGLAAIQGPKLLKDADPPAAETAKPDATATQAAPAAAQSGTGEAVVSTPPPVRAPKSQTTQLAGVVIVPEQPVEPGEGQLDSFTRFDAKDPFVQLVTTENAAGREAQRGNPTTGSTATSTRGGSGSKSSASRTGTPPATSTQGSVTIGDLLSPEPTVAPTLAIVRINGKLQKVDLKGKFPSGDKAFVLRSLKPDRAVIAVADGSFASSETLTLRVGRSVTLVNQATGVRYVLRLIFVGSGSEQVTGFSAK